MVLSEFLNMLTLCIYVNIYSVRTCIISRGDTFVITGGGEFNGRATDRVSLYSSSDGWVRDLASLNTGRQRHGCASFTDSNGQEVRMSPRTDKTMFILTPQVLLVAGGFTTQGNANTLGTTEILNTIDGSWTFAGNLPHRVWGISGATLDNTVFLMGER